MTTNNKPTLGASGQTAQSGPTDEAGSGVCLAHTLRFPLLKNSG